MVYGMYVSVPVELRVSGCYGAFLSGPESHCVVMAALDWHTALAFEFTHSKSLDETRGVAIQVRARSLSPCPHLNQMGNILKKNPNIYIK